MTDKELEKIYNEAYKAVYWTAMSLLKNEADAEDVVQDTFVTLIESYDTIEDKSKVTAWLKKIAANKCLNRLTRTKTDAAPDEFFDDVEAIPEDFLPDTIVESAEMRKIIMDIINKSLSEDIRRTLILFYFDEMSTRDIAETLGVPEGTVRRRLNFARNKIKKEVEKYEEENKTKLFGMAALPFLSKLFIKEAEQVPFKAMPSSLITTLSASAKASTQGAGIKVAAAAAKKGTGIMINKIIIGTAAGIVAVGAAVAAVIAVINRKPEASKPSDVPSATIGSELPSDTPEPTFTDSFEETDGAFDNGAKVFDKMPKLYGKEIALVCTVGELQAKGFEFTDGGVIEDGAVSMTISDDIYDNEWAFLCHLQNPEQYNGVAGKDAVVAAIEIYMLETDLSFYDIKLDMPEKNFTSEFGTPAYVIGSKTDRTFYYYFLDEKGNVYEFCFVNTTGNPDDAKLMTLTYGVNGYMTSRSPLKDEI